MDKTGAATEHPSPTTANATKGNHNDPKQAPHDKDQGKKTLEGMARRIEGLGEMESLCAEIREDILIITERAREEAAERGPAASAELEKTWPSVLEFAEMLAELEAELALERAEEESKAVAMPSAEGGDTVPVTTTGEADGKGTGDEDDTGAGRSANSLVQVG
jgi:hypothetical protein